MDQSSKFTYKALENTERIKLKYKFDNKKLKGNRNLLQAKIFSPSARSNQNLVPNDTSPVENSYNHPLSQDEDRATRYSNAAFTSPNKPFHYDYSAMSPRTGPISQHNCNFSDGRYNLSNKALHKQFQRLNHRMDGSHGMYSPQGRKYQSLAVANLDNSNDYDITHLPKIHNDKLIDNYGSGQPYYVQNNESPIHFTENRHSVNSNGNYNELRKAMHDEIKDTNTHSLGGRKNSVKQKLNQQIAYSTKDLHKAQSQENLRKIHTKRISAKNECFSATDNVQHQQPTPAGDILSNQKLTPLEINEAIRSLSPGVQVKSPLRKKNKKIALPRKFIEKFDADNDDEFHTKMTKKALKKAVMYKIQTKFNSNSNDLEINYKGYEYVLQNQPNGKVPVMNKNKTARDSIQPCDSYHHNVAPQGLMDFESPELASNYSAKTNQEDEIRDLDTPFFGQKRLCKNNSTAFEHSQGKPSTRADTGETSQRDQNVAQPRPLKLNLAKTIFKTKRHDENDDFYTNHII